MFVLLNNNNICLQPQKVKFTSVQINMKQVSYTRELPRIYSITNTKHVSFRL